MARQRRQATTVQADANPTKEFFVSVLAKDITLIAAIIDLVDNCVDGARRLRGDKRFDGLRIDITASSDRFIISDNCGGISVAVAKEYAFRFGRPENVVPPKYATGQFGVGMKRALFKLGDHFRIASSTHRRRTHLSGATSMTSPRSEAMSRA